MLGAQNAYNALVHSGMPMEDARNVLPIGVTHRLVWKCNATSLKHALQARSCWIAQTGLWEPVIRGMVEELAAKVHPLFRRLIAPPCVDAKTNKFKACKYPIENAAYIKGEDPHPPCALWLHHHSGEAEGVERSCAGRAKWIALTVRGRKPDNPLTERGIMWRPSYEPGVHTLPQDETAAMTMLHKWDQMAKLWGRNASTWEAL
jgi:hypothetical protein